MAKAREIIGKAMWIAFAISAAGHADILGHWLGTDFEADYQPGRYSQGESRIRAALRKDPESAILNFNLGAFLFQQGKFTEALEAFQKAHEKALRARIVDQSLLAKIEYNLGNAAFRLGDFAIAQAMYESTLLHNSAMDDARANLEVTKDRLRRAAQDRSPTPTLANVPPPPAFDLKSGAGLTISEPHGGRSIDATELTGKASDRSGAPAASLTEIKAKISVLQKQSDELRVRMEARAEIKTQQLAQLDRLADGEAQTSQHWTASSALSEGPDLNLTEQAHETGTEDSPNAYQGSAEDLFKDMRAWTVLPPQVGGHYAVSRRARYDFAHGVWSKDSLNFKVVRQRPNFVGENGMVVSGTLRTELFNRGGVTSAVEPLVAPEGFEIDPGSFHFENAAVKNFRLYQSDDGHYLLSLDPALATTAAASGFRYSLRPTQKNFYTQNPDSAAPPPALDPRLEKGLREYLVPGMTDAQRAEAIQSFVLSRAKYTTDDNPLDHYLKQGPGNKLDRITKIFFQDPDLPAEIQGKGADCDVWGEFYCMLARHEGLPCDLVIGYLGDGSKNLVRGQGHAWSRVYLPREHRRIEIDATPGKEGLTEEQKLHDQMSALLRQQLALEDSTKFKQAFQQNTQELIDVRRARDRLVQAREAWQWQMQKDFEAIQAEKDPTRKAALIKTFTEGSDRALDQVRSGLAEAARGLQTRGSQNLWAHLQVENAGALLEKIMGWQPFDKAGRYDALVAQIQSLTAQLKPAQTMFSVFQGAAEPNAWATQLSDRGYLHREGQFWTDSLPSPSALRLTPDGSHYLMTTGPWATQAVFDGKAQFSSHGIYDPVLTSDGSRHGMYSCVHGGNLSPPYRLYYNDKLLAEDAEYIPQTLSADQLHLYQFIQPKPAIRPAEIYRDGVRVRQLPAQLQYTQNPYGRDHSPYLFRRGGQKYQGGAFRPEDVILFLGEEIMPGQKFTDRSLGIFWEKGKKVMFLRGTNAQSGKVVYAILDEGHPPTLESAETFAQRKNVTVEAQPNGTNTTFNFSFGGRPLKLSYVNGQPYNKFVSRGNLAGGRNNELQSSNMGNPFTSFLTNLESDQQDIFVDPAHPQQWRMLGLDIGADNQPAYFKASADGQGPVAFIQGGIPRYEIPNSPIAELSGATDQEIGHSVFTVKVNGHAQSYLDGLLFDQGSYGECDFQTVPAGTLMSSDLSSHGDDPASYLFRNWSPPPAAAARLSLLKVENDPLVLAQHVQAWAPQLKPNAQNFSDLLLYFAQNYRHQNNLRTTERRTPAERQMLEAMAPYPEAVVTLSLPAPERAKLLVELANQPGVNWTNEQLDRIAERVQADSTFRRALGNELFTSRGLMSPQEDEEGPLRKLRARLAGQEY